MNSSFDGFGHRSPAGENKTVAKCLCQRRIARQVRREPRDDGGGRGVGEAGVDTPDDGNEVTSRRPGVGSGPKVLVWPTPRLWRSRDDDHGHRAVPTPNTPGQAPLNLIGVSPPHWCFRWSIEAMRERRPDVLFAGTP